MNYFFLILFIFLVLYFFLNWFAKTSSKKISKAIRLSIIILSAFLAVLMFYAGRYIFSLPFLLAILPLIKTKAGISLLQLIRIWGLLRILKNSGRFNFNNINQNIKNSSMGGVEYVLNVNPGQEVHTISFQNISSTFKTNLTTMQDAIKGEAKKFVWYDGSSFHWVRLDKPMQFTEIADGRFSTQLVLRQQIQ